MKVLIIGPVLAGKSFLARAIRRELQDQGREVDIVIVTATGGAALGDMIGSMSEAAGADLVIEIVKSRVAGEYGG